MIIRQLKMTICKSLFDYFSYLCDIIISLNVIKMETKTKSLRWLLPLLSALFLLSGLTACDSTEDTDDSSGFEQIPYSNPVIAKDFKQSDIEALVEYAVYAQNLRLQIYQISSNGWNGDFFGGPGDKSDASRYYDYLSMILQNSDKYIAAIDNLDKNGILTTSTTTRGIIGKLKTAIYGYGEEAQITKDEVLDRLNALRVMGNADLQRKFFNALAPEKEGGPDPRGGHTDPKEFFKSLYAGELNAVVDKIDYVWQHVSAAESFGSEFSDYFEMANDKSGNYLQKVYKRTAKVAKNVGEVYLTGVDKIAGGWGSTIVDGLEEIKENTKLMKKTLKGELTGKDVKKYIVGQLTGKVKNTFGDYIGEGIGSEITDPIVEEIEEQVTELIVEGNGDDAKENGVGVVETVEGEGKGVKTTIVVDEDKGKIKIGLPDKDGKSVITTKPGKKKITTITTGGERVTQEVTVKEGKNEVEAVPLLEKATVSLSQSSLKFDADGGTETIEVTSNCPYCRVSDEKGDWYSISRKGKVITVIVERNQTDEPRSKTFTVEVSQNGKTVDAKTTFTITQKIAEQKEGKISVSPSSLEFEASGGEKSVQVTVEGMEYYGGYVENDNDTWITISTAPHTTLVIKAAANDTGKERSGVVYAYATNVTNPSYKDIVQTPIIITQKGDGGLFTITPNPVRFDAQGGEIAVTIVGKEVKRIKDVDFHSLSWIGGSGMGLSAVISALPNTSTAERIADFDIIVEMNDGSTVKQSFMAYQNASTSQGQSENNGSSDIKVTKVNVENSNLILNCRDSSSPSSISSGLEGFNFVEDCSFTQSGSTLHVSATYNYKSVSFDLVNLTSKNQDYIIKNFKYTEVIPNARNYKVELGDIPLSWKKDLTDGDRTYMSLSFNYKVSEGLKVLFYSNNYADEQTWEYVDSPTNYVNLWLIIDYIKTNS